MTDLITLPDGFNLDIKALPIELQEKLNKYAVIDILKEQARERIDAKRIDIDKYLKQWIDTKNSENTAKTYKKAIDDLFSFIKKIGIEHPLLIKAEHVDQYIIELKNNDMKANSIRLKITACSSFYQTLKRYGHIKVNPFYKSALPKKEYKKAVKTDQNKTIPVMNEEEYQTILKKLKENTKLKGKQAYIKNISECSRSLIPAVHFMAVYGLRVGSISTIEIKDAYITYMQKGNKAGTQELTPESIKRLKGITGRPFKKYHVTTIQHAFKRLTRQLKKDDLIRYDYSCHDLRHYFAYKHYTEHKDIVKLKNILGHASINVTDIYLQSICIV